MKAALLHASRQIAGSDSLGAMPVLNLLYLGFLFLPALLGRVPAHPHWLIYTLASLLAFLPLYVLSFRCGASRQAAVAVALLALGVALTPVNPLANTYVIYACGVAGAIPERRLAAAGTVAVLLGYLAVIALLDWPVMIAAVTAIVGIGVASGNHAWTRNLRQQAELRLSQEEVRQLARVAERERIGRDLHDLLGHSLSLVALKAELAGKLIDRDPGAARRELGELESVARQALQQVRQAVTGIRAAGLMAEVARARLMLESADIALTVTRELPPLPPAVETVLALALREATVNVLRHARARHVWVELHAAAGCVTLGVADDGAGPAGGTGTGLAGMGERVRDLGGTLVAGARPGGGFALTLSLPLPGAEADRGVAPIRAPAGT